MSDLTITELWFKRAKPEPTARNFDTQLGCHLEEVVEMLDSFIIQDERESTDLEAKFQAVRNGLHELANILKSGDAFAVVYDPVGFLDALADQIVTATGSGYMAGMNVPVALDRVNASNFSKFSDDGMPIFDANGKITKGPNYRKPNLEDLV